MVFTPQRYFLRLILLFSAVYISLTFFFSYSYQAMMTQMQTIISLFVEEVQRVLEQMLASMHQESFAGLGLCGALHLFCTEYTLLYSAFARVCL